MWLFKIKMLYVPTFRECGVLDVSQTIQMLGNYVILVLKLLYSGK